MCAFIFVCMICDIYSHVFVCMYMDRYASLYVHTEAKGRLQHPVP